MKEDLEILLNHLEELDKNIYQTEAQINKIHSNWSSARIILGSDGEFIEEEINLLIVMLPSAKRLVSATSSRLEHWKNVQMHFEVDNDVTHVVEVKEEHTDSCNVMDDDFFHDDPLESDPLDGDFGHQSVPSSTVNTTPEMSNTVENDVLERTLQPERTRKTAKVGKGFPDLKNEDQPHKNMSKKRQSRSSITNPLLKSALNSRPRGRPPLRNGVTKQKQTKLNKTESVKPQMTLTNSSEETKEMRLILTRLSLETLLKYNLTLPPPPVSDVKPHSNDFNSISSRIVKKATRKIPTVKPKSESKLKQCVDENKVTEGQHLDDYYPADDDYQPDHSDVDPDSDGLEYCPDVPKPKSKARQLRKSSRARCMKAAKNFHRSKTLISFTSNKAPRKRNRKPTSGEIAGKKLKAYCNINSKRPCPKCGKPDLNLAELEEHISSFHPLKERHPDNLNCEICPEKVYSSNSKFLKHIIRIHEGPSTPEAKTISCYKCDKHFVTKYMFNRHIFYHKYRRSRPFACDVCEMRYRLEEKLKTHKSVTHCSVKTKFQCRICPRNYTQMCSLREHEKLQHAGDAEVFAFVCQEVDCIETFSDELFLQTHINCHKTEGPFNCAYCHVHRVKQRNFLTAIELSKHLDVHTGKYSNPLHKCDKCEKAFTTRRQVLQHNARKHGAPANVQCPVCPKRFIDDKDLGYHMRTHERQKKMALEPPKPKTVVCDICGKYYVGEVELRKHKISIHERKFEQMCEICGMVVSLRSTYKNHMKSHKGQKNYPCYFCERKFVRIDTLNVHMNTHTLERPNKCPLCPWSFSAKVRLRTHMKSHEKGTVIPFVKDKKLNKIKPKIFINPNSTANPDFGINNSSVGEINNQNQSALNNCAPKIAKSSTESSIITQNAPNLNLSSINPNVNYSYNPAHINSASYCILQRQQSHSSSNVQDSLNVNVNATNSSNNPFRTIDFDWMMN